MQIFDHIVIGKGMIGAAAARYLSQISDAVALVGPDEPIDPVSHTGVFASHYDEGRISNIYGRDFQWGVLTDHGHNQYAEIQEKSGVTFHHPVGGLIVAPQNTEFRYLTFSDAITKRFALSPLHYASSAEITQAHPMMSFPEGMRGLYTGAPTGYINPRALVKAETIVAEQQGTTIIREIATHVSPGADRVTVTLASGETITGRRVLIATGGFTNFFDLVQRKLDLSVKTETIMFAELDETEAARHAQVPPLLYGVEDDIIADIYMLPPIRYPDGKVYAKIGANTVYDEELTTLEQTQDWMKLGDNHPAKPAMICALEALLPELRAQRYEMAQCLITRTPHLKPYFDQITDNVFTAVGANGVGAQNADGLGWLAALMLRNQPWPEPFTRHDFRAVFA